MSTSERFGKTFPPRSADHLIVEVESHTMLPVSKGPWTKIGEATVSDNAWGADVNKMLINKARAMGGDALVKFHKFKTIARCGFLWTTTAHAEIWRAKE
jgi:hypothetical protein